MGDTKLTMEIAALSAEEVKVQTKISEDFYSMFSNQIRVAASPTEFRLFFGENFPTAAGKIVIVEQFSIIITPVQAKNLAKLLSETVKALEEKFGVIPEIGQFEAKTQSPGSKA